MSDENRPLGDWQRKDQRKDANDLYQTPNAKPWYKQTFWIIVLLLLFWPVGIVLCWKSDWHIAFKIIATIFVAFCVFLMFNMQQAVKSMGY